MKTMNGITNELLVKKAKRNWRTRCGAFLLAVLASWCGGKAVFGEVVITPGTGNTLPATTVFAPTPAPVGGVRPAATYSGDAATGDPKSFAWDSTAGQYKNVLNIWEGGQSVVTAVTPTGGTGTTPGTWTLYSSDTLKFTGTGDNVSLTGSMTWSGYVQVEAGASATIGFVSGNLTTLTDRFSNLGILNLSNQTTGNPTENTLFINSNNSGTINIYNAILSYTGSNFGGGGTISIDARGRLDLSSSTRDVYQNIVGGHDRSRNDNYGTINVTRGGSNSTTFHNSLTGEIGFTGGGNALLTANNNGMTELNVFDNTSVYIQSQDNLGTTGVNLYGYGNLVKDKGATGSLTITNAIQVGNPEGAGVTVGGISSSNTTFYPWSSDANSFHDGGHRFIIQGVLSSAYLGAMLNINNDSSGSSGTVVLASQSNQGYSGSFGIYKGTLEVSKQAQLGPSSDNARYYVGIGGFGTESLGIPATFRVAGAAGVSETITHYIALGESGSSYEVFTGTNGSIDSKAIPQDLMGNGAMKDSDRFTVHQAGQIGDANTGIGQTAGVGTLNKKGDGVLVLDRYNSYTGDTKIWHGVLQISQENSINNLGTSTLYIGGEPLKEDGNFRPVFQTTMGAADSNTLNIYAQVQVNQTNSIIRTTGLGNETILHGTISTGAVQGVGGPNNMPYDAVLNKDGAGMLTLAGNGQWGAYGNGDMNIIQGTVKFSTTANLAKGTIYIGLDPSQYTNLEDKDVYGKDITYKATLKLADNASTIAISNKIVLGTPATVSLTQPDAGSYIDVGKNSQLTVTQLVSESAAAVGSNLNKIGAGELVLASTTNSYTGWNNIYEGTLSTTAKDNLSTTAGVDLVGEGTVFKMSADQILHGLRGGMDPTYNTDSLTKKQLLTDIDDPAAWTRKVMIGDNTLTLDIKNFKDGDDNMNNIFRGHIVGTGTLVKQGYANSVFAAGFGVENDSDIGQFTGGFDIQAGTIQLLTDATITGLTGKTGTYLDTKDNTLTIKISKGQEYKGTIINSVPTTWDENTHRPLIVKDGIGTLVAGFYDTTDLSTPKAYLGDLTIKKGDIQTTSEYHMEGGGTLTFFADFDRKTPVTLDVGGGNSGKTGSMKAVFAKGGADGAEYSTVKVDMGNAATSWKTAKGSTTVAQILANASSDYSGLVADTTSTLFGSISLEHVYGVGRHDLHVNMDVTGFGGVGDTFNTKAVGDNLDNIRVTDLTDSGLAPLIADLWAAGSNLTDKNGNLLSANIREERAELIRGVFQQMSADTIANAMFMGLDKPWQRAFDRLNLDCQMVYLTPPGASQQPQYRGQAIANMRNIWFTPSVQSLTARSDGNARKFGIDRPGYQIGFDKRVAQNTSVGFVLGYSNPTLRQGDDRVEASDFQFGLYGGAMVGYYVEMKGFIGFGHQNFKSNRTIYLPGDKVVPTGVDDEFRAIGGNQRTLTSHGRFDGDTFNFSFEVSRPLFLGFAILRPTIGLDSEHAFRYGFTETGDATSMSFNRSSLSRTRARFGLGLETCTFDNAIFTGRLGYAALLGGNDYATATGQFVNAYAPTQTVRSVAVGTSYFEAGVGTRIFLNPAKTLVLVGSYDASIADHWAEHQAVVGFQYRY